jgi:hypothetical protein
LTTGRRKRRRRKNVDARGIFASLCNAGGILMPTVAAVAMFKVTFPDVYVDTVTVTGPNEQVASVGIPPQAKGDAACEGVEISFRISSR